MSASLQSSSPSAPVLSTGEMKSPAAFRTISEVADNLGLPQHVLRFWESKFNEIKPLKRGGGRRYYRPEDVRIIHDIQDLLHNQGFTIRGVQKLLREGKTAASVRAGKAQGAKVPGGFDPAQAQLAIDALAAVQDGLRDEAPETQGLSSDKRRELQDVLGELKAMRKLLQQSGI